MRILSHSSGIVAQACLVVLLTAGAAACPAQTAAAPTPFPTKGPATFPAAPAPVPGMLRYVDAVNGWSIDYPQGWWVDPADPAFVRFQDPGDGALVGVHVKQTDLPLEVIVDKMAAYEEQYHRGRGLTMTVSSRRQVALSDGTPAVDLVVEIAPGGRSHQLYTAKAGKMFHVDAETYATSWDKFSADFDRMLGSFQLPA